MSDPIWKSDVWHDGKKYHVSTILRTYETIEGTSSGNETFAFEEGGNLVFQGGGILEHQAFCRCLLATGEVYDPNDEKHERFYKP